MKQKNIEIVKKQSLIDQTRKSVMLWVAGASAVIGAAVVISFLLFQTLLFNSKVIKAQAATAQRITSNINAIDELKGNVRVVGGDEKLKLPNIKSSSDARPLQAVLDALPADDNRLALGASLQQKILHDIPGLQVDSLSVDQSGAMSTTGAAVGSDGELGFSVSMSGSPEALKQALSNMERSIRAINIITISATSSGNTVNMQLNGTASYQKPISLDLTERKIKG